MLYRWLISTIFIALVIALSITPGAEVSNDTIFVWLVINTATLLQKIMHVVLYAALAACLLWTLEFIDSYARRASLTAVVTIGLGAALEFVQTMVPGRFGTLSDILLNTMGVIVGIVATRLIYKLQRVPAI